MDEEDDEEVEEDDEEEEAVSLLLLLLLGFESSTCREATKSTRAFWTAAERTGSEGRLTTKVFWLTV